MGYFQMAEPAMPELPCLREARYVATCYLEHHPGIYHDVYDHLRGICDPMENEDLLAAAALYTPVVHTRPDEEDVRAQFGDPVCDLLLAATFNPDYSQEQKMEAIDLALEDLQPSAMILLMAALKAYFKSDLQAYIHEKGGQDADLAYCYWLEGHANRLEAHAPRLRSRILRMIGYFRRTRSARSSAKSLSWRQFWTQWTGKLP